MATSKSFSSQKSFLLVALDFFGSLSVNNLHPKITAGGALSLWLQIPSASHFFNTTTAADRTGTSSMWQTDTWLVYHLLKNKGATVATEAGGWTKGKSREGVPGGACTKASVQVSRPSPLIELPRVDLPLPAVSTTATRHSTQAPIPAHPPLRTSLNNHLPTRFRGSANDFVDCVVSSLILSPLHQLTP